MAGSLWVRRLWVLAAGLVVAVIGTVLFVIGLDDADKVSSSAGLFIGLAGLAVSTYGVVLARRPPASSSSSSAPGAVPPGPVPGASGERSVVIGGDNSAPIVTGDGNEVR